MSYEAQRGLYLHPTYAATVDREPLGVLDAWLWAREFKDADGQRGGEKESARWLSGYEHVVMLSEKLPQTRLVYVADREADIMALMVKARDLGAPADWLLRCQHDRNLRGGKKLWARVGNDHFRVAVPSWAKDPTGEAAPMGKAWGVAGGQSRRG